MGVLYWLAVWLMMAAAFATAWAFIVKGCERLDERNPPPTKAPEESH